MPDWRRDLGCVLLALTPCLAQTRQSNPHTSARAIEEGKRLYRFYCVNCHGMDGASGRGARLASKNHRMGSSDQEMFQTILNGIPATEMPGAWLEEDSIWKILAFVRTLEDGATQESPADPAAAARGRETYSTKGGCAGCHSIGMGGGRLGPDLTTIGSTRSREHLRESLLAPDKTVSARYTTVQVATRDGHTHQGILLNEDEYTIHIMDPGEQILSFRRAELKEAAHSSKSLMPAYGKLLSSEELDDLLSFLCSLRGEAKK